MKITIGLLVALGIALIMACGNNDDDGDADDNQFRPDVIDCESAVAHLKNCCPDLDPSLITCHHFYLHDEGCGDSRTEQQDPDLNQDQSDCIRDQSCQAIQAHGVCKRVVDHSLSIVTGLTASVDGGGNTLTAPVCP